MIDIGLGIDSFPDCWFCQGHKMKNGECLFLPPLICKSTKVKGE